VDAVSGAWVDPAAALHWMAGHGDRLQALVAEQGDGRPVRLPADDGAVRANLIFAAEAITATAGEAGRRALAGFAEGLDAWFDQEAEELAAHLERAEGAIALEQHLQFGTTPGRDPSLDAGLERRTRLSGWVRLFVLGLEAHLGPAADGVADDVLAWIHARQRELARLVVTLDRHAKAGMGAGAPADALDELGQHAVVRAHVRQLVEALGASLPPGAASGGD
jgi:hypothetical protein